MSARGWCYLLESYGLNKGDFNKAANLINDCRKNWLLPLDICADDQSRHFDRAEWLNTGYTVEQRARGLVEGLKHNHKSYTPISFWEGQPYYIELLVEKIDLTSLVAPICNWFHIMYGNAKGWSDLNTRGDMMERFREAEKRGQKPVLLYCGDHDPSGLLISETLMLNMIQMTNAVKWDPKKLIIDRFGLNSDFIDEHELTWIDGLTSGGGADLASPTHRDHDKDYVQSYLDTYGARKCESNALVAIPSVGRQLLRDTIHKYLPDDALEQYQERLKAPREELRPAICS